MALKVFNLFVEVDKVGDAEGEDVNVETYEVNIASSGYFDLVPGYHSCGCSFRMASRLVDVTKSLSKMGCLSRCMEGKRAINTRSI